MLVRRLLMIAGAVVLLAAPGPAAAAKPGTADKREAQRECRAERGTTDATREAFDAKYGSFGKCVTKKAQEAKGERKQAQANAARECRAEREDDAEAFRETYGTNAGGNNAFGKCVSEKAKAKRAAQDAADAEQAEEVKRAATECDAERDDDANAFRETYGTNGNKKNAFGNCVSQKARDRS